MTSKNIRSFLLLACGILWVNLAEAQESVNSAGSDATGIGGSAAYSIGQVIYTTNFGTSGSVAQGVQHPYEIFTIGISELDFGISLSAFPNPTMNNLTLQLSELTSENMVYQLFDMQGKLIHEQQIVALQTQIDMSQLLMATYFLHVFNQDKTKSQSFKIIKTN
ncbi:MAG: T9SS type A sorting domain-containing protein [Flavobacteriales bacterium]|nr:T9SS type A sorting domain-containing protein [Flavobacteriales bacterium]